MNAVTNTTSLKAALRRALHRPSGWSTLYAGVIGALAAPVALADPTGGTVVEGDADINPQGNGTVINQTSQRAIIDWETFNIGVDEYVLFNQPGSSAVILNRVIGGDPSTILGNLTANGQVFLVNPNGVFFGESAMLDVGGLLATTLDISNADFMAGNYAFEKTGSSHGEVINAGQITARDGGYVVLAGDKVSNSGVIAARAGHVVLAAGRAITLDVEGDGLVNFAVDEATLSDLAGVHNAGDILADGGLVLMTAKVASELVTTAVNNEGLIQAHGISEQQDGTIVLTAEGGDIVNAGVLDADGINSNAGGVIYLHGDENVDLTSESVITADGAGSAEGGVVRAIAKETLWFREGASITATGGNENGGFVEVSGHGGLQLRGSVITGAGGSFIIDPSLVTLSSNSASTGSNIIQVSTLEGYLNANDNVAIIASNSITANSSVSAISATGSGDLRFVIGNVPSGSSGLCSFDPALCVNPIAGGTVINLLSGGTINLSGVDINIAGDFSATASQGTVSLGTIIANTIKVVNATTITVNGNLTANGASTGGLGVHLDVNGLSGMITVNGAITATNGGITLTNSIGRDSLGAPVITVTGSSGGKAISAAGDININADGGIQLGTDTNGTSFGGFVGRRVTSTAGSITIQSGVSIYTGTLSAINGNIALTAVGSSTLGGNPNATILVGSNAGFGTTGFDIIAGGDITLNATAGSSNSQGGFAQIAAGNITGGGTVAVTANGLIGGTPGDSEIDIGNVSGGIIDLTANVVRTGNLSASSATASGIGVDIDTTGSGSNNARIFIDGTITTTAGGVSLSVSNGDIIIAGSSASGKAIDAAGDVKLTAADTIQIGTGAITDSGNYDARSITATGNIDLQAGGSYIAAGSLDAGGNINVINSAAGAAQILLTDLSASTPTTRANVTAGGSVNIAATANNGFGSNTRIIVGDVSGTSVNMRAITFDSYGGDAIINAGNITATTGSLTLLASNSGNVVSGGGGIPPAAASIDVGNLNAGTTLSVTATANPNQASGGHITAGTISAEVINIEHNAAQADIALGAITANNTDGKASVSIITGSDPGVTQAGSITIGGDVTISGTSVSLSIPSSSFAGLASINGNLVVTATNGNIDTGTGSLAVSANAVLFSAAGDILLSNSTLNVGSGSTSFAGDSETATAAGLAGETPSAAFIAGGTLDLGNLAISGNYLWLQANTFGTIGSVGLPSTALVQFTTHDANRLLGLEATSAQTSLAGFYVSNFSAADTLAFGDSAHLGGLLMAEFGEVNLSANNLIFATDGDVTGTNPVYGADVTFLTDTLSNITARLNTGIVNVTAGNNIDLTMAGPAIFSFGSDTFGNVGLITTGDLTLQSGLSAADILLQANTGAVLLGTNTLTATNAITLDADTTFTGTGLLTAATLNLIGTAITDFNVTTDIDSLIVNSGNNIDVDNTAHTGNLNVSFLSSGYGNVSLISTGDLALQNNLAAADILLQANDIILGANTLTATNAITLAAINSAAGTGLLTANTLNLIGNPGTNFNLSTDINTLDVNGGNDVIISNTGNLAATFSSGFFNTVELITSGDITLQSNLQGLNLTFQANTGSIDLGANTLNGVNIILDTDAGFTSTGLITANSVDLIGSSTTDFNVTGDIVNLTLTSGRDFVIDNSANTGNATLHFGSGTLGNVSVTYGGNASLSTDFNGTSLDLTTAGTLSLNNQLITAANAVSFDVGGDVTGIGLITASTLNLTGAATSNFTLTTDINTLNVISGNNFDVTNTGNLTANFATGTYGNVELLTSGDISLTSALTAADIILQANTGAINLGTNTLTATNAITLDADTTSTGTGLLAAATLNLIGGASTDFNILTNAGAFNIQSGNGITINNTAFTGAATVLFGSGTFGIVDMSTGGSLALLSNLSAADITLRGFTGLALGANALTATNNILLDTGGGFFSTGLLTANSLTLAGGATTNFSVNTNAANIDVLSGNNIFIDNSANAVLTTLTFGSGTFGDVSGLFNDILLASDLSAASLNMTTANIQLGLNRVITTTGDLILNANGTVSGTGLTSLNAGNLTLGSGATYTFENLSVVTTADLNLSTGSITATGINGITLDVGGIFIGTGLITADSLTLIGAVTTDFDVTTDINTLTVTSGRDVDVSNIGSLSATFGTGTFGTVSLATSGDLILLSNLSAADILLQANTGAINLGTNILTATNAITLDADTTFTGTGLLTTGTLNLIGGATTDFNLTTDVENLILSAGRNFTIDNSTSTGGVTFGFGGNLGTVDIIFGGNATMVNAFTGSSLSLTTPGNLDLGSNTITANGTVRFDIDGSATATGLITAGSFVLIGETNTGYNFTTNTDNIQLLSAGDITIDNTAHTGSANVFFGSDTFNNVALTMGGNTAIGAETGLTANNATLVVNNGSLDVSGNNFDIASDMRLTATGSLLLSGVTVNAGTFIATAGGTITDASIGLGDLKTGTQGSAAPATITADAVSLVADGDILLGQTTFTIGSGTISDIPGDQDLLSVLQAEGLISDTSGPNATFIANGMVEIGNTSVAGGYLLIEALDINFTGNITGPDDLLVQLIPFGGTGSVSLENTASTGSGLDLDAQDMNAIQQGATIALGYSTYTGEVTLGQDGIVDLGSQNFIVATKGNIDSIDNVTSTGLVSSVETILFGEDTFETPTTEELDLTTDGGNTGDDEETGDEEGEDTDGDGVPDTGNENSLIKHDTTEEGGVCKV